MSATTVDPFNENEDFDDAVRLLVERFGAEEAEWRLLAALSRVRQAKIEEARRCQ